ncbi:hypothetical protein YPPY66_1306, partial [Yersinia pestis PY-66]
MPYLINIK